MLKVTQWLLARYSIVTEQLHMPKISHEHTLSQLKTSENLIFNVAHANLTKPNIQSTYTHAHAQKKLIKNLSKLVKTCQSSTLD